MAMRGAVTWAVVAIGVSIGAAIGLGVAYGMPARADEPRPEAAAPANTVARVRELVRELETQAEAQRAQLKQTEATLERARALLRGLEDGAVVDEDLRKLKAQEEQLAQRIAQHQKLGMSPYDPALKFMQAKLDHLREEIRDYERSHGPRP